MAISPSPANYSLGKGVGYFNKLISNTSVPWAYDGERDLGNMPTLNINVALEDLPHYLSRADIRTKDLIVSLEITPGGNFTLDEITDENLALLTFGSIEKVTQTMSAVTDEEHVAKHGRRIVLKNRGISLVTVSDGVTDYELGKDFIIDTTLKDDKIGRIYIPETSTIAQDTDVQISYTAAATEYRMINALTATRLEGQFRFVSANPVGEQFEINIWRMNITPSGDTAFIGDDWSTLGFNFEILKDSLNHPLNPYYQIIMSS